MLILVYCRASMCISVCYHMTPCIIVRHRVLLYIIMCHRISPRITVYRRTSLCVTIYHRTLLCIVIHPRMSHTHRVSLMPCITHIMHHPTYKLFDPYITLSYITMCWSPMFTVNCDIILSSSSSCGYEEDWLLMQHNKWRLTQTSQLDMIALDRTRAYNMVINHWVWMLMHWIW